VVDTESCFILKFSLAVTKSSGNILKPSSFIHNVTYPPRSETDSTCQPTCVTRGQLIFDYLVIGLFFLLLSLNTHLVTNAIPKIGKLAINTYGNIAM